MLETDLIQAQGGGSKDLLIALHGLGDSMEGYRWLPRALQMPSLNILLVNAPDAYFGGYSWYDFAAEPGPGIERSYRLMEELLQDWFARGYSAERTILFGFSQGCLMSYETGIRHAQRFAGIIGVSGYVHEPDRLLRLASPQARSQKFLVTHGTDDALIPLAQVRPQVDQLRAAEMQIDFRTFEKEHTIIDDEIVLFRNFIQEKLPPLASR
jgi:phospholipase/carboxylesterase